MSSGEMPLLDGGNSGGISMHQQWQRQEEEALLLTADASRSSALAGTKSGYTGP